METLLILVLLAGFLDAAVYQANMKRVNRLQHRGLRSKKTTGALPIYDYGMSEFVVEVAIGTPPQNFNFLLSVASPGVYVVGRNCTSQSCNGSPESGYTKHHYDERLSSTYRDLHETFYWSYGSGPVYGNMSIDDFMFGGLTAPSEVIAIATGVNDEFGGKKADGILGLGLPSLTILNVAYQLDFPMFSIWINPTEYKNGLLTIGATDSIHCDVSKIRWVNAVSETDWFFQINGFQLGSYNVNRKMPAMSVVSYMFSSGPQVYIQQLAATIGAVWDEEDYYFKIACSKWQTLSDLIFNVGGIAYTVTADNYIADIGLGGGQCVFTFIPLEDDMWSFGGHVFRQYCISYDVENRKIGFARQKQQ